jgi:hypothetical protein
LAGRTGPAHQAWDCRKLDSSVSVLKKLGERQQGQALRPQFIEQYPISGGRFVHQNVQPVQILRSQAAAPPRERESLSDGMAGYGSQARCTGVENLALELHLQLYRDVDVSGEAGWEPFNWIVCPASVCLLVQPFRLVNSTARPESPAT